MALQEKPRVLVSDKLSETAVQIFRDRGIDVDFQPDLGKDKDALLKQLSKYEFSDSDAEKVLAAYAGRQSDTLSVCSNGFALHDTFSA